MSAPFSAIPDAAPEQPAPSPVPHRAVCDTCGQPAVVFQRGHGEWSHFNSWRCHAHAVASGLVTNHPVRGVPMPTILRCERCLYFDATVREYAAPSCVRGSIRLCADCAQELIS